MWTQPQTAAQKAYFSKHAPKRRVYGFVMTGLQGAHAILAFAAWYSLLTYALGKVPALLPAAPWLAGTILLICHVVFRVTWETYFYDRLDKHQKTDSSLLIPVGLLILLLITEAKGAQVYLASLVEKPAEQIPVAFVDKTHENTIASMDKQYAVDVGAIKSVYKDKEAAAALPYERQIRSWRNRSAASPADEKYRRNQVASLERQRDQALAPVLQARAAALEKALNAHTERKTEANNSRDLAVGTIQNETEKEKKRFDTEISQSRSYAWIISAILLALISGLGYARVRINVKSGILPLRNYTVLDAHGSALERLYTAIADAFNRRSLQLAVAIHRAASPKEAITSFDGTVVAKPGTYNTPAGFYPPGKTLDQAAIEVMQKIAGIQKANPGWKPTQGDYDAELKRSMSLNGSYPSAPYQGDVGKGSPPPVAEAQPSGVSSTAPDPGTEACQTVSDRLSEYEPGKPASMPLLIANLDKWTGRARQCWRRAHPLNTEVKSPEKQYENRNRAEKYAALIETFGNRVEWRNGPNVSDHEVLFHSLGWTDDMIRANVEKYWPAIYNTLKYLGELKPDKQPVDLL